MHKTNYELTVENTKQRLKIERLERRIKELESKATKPTEKVILGV